MKLKKFTLIMALILCISSIPNVYAVDEHSSNIQSFTKYQTRWANVMNIRTSVSGSSSEIKANAAISTKHKEVSGTLYLQRYESGYWSSVKSWKVKGKGFVKLAKNYNGGSGKYRTKLSINVEGEDITYYSSTKYIN